MQDLIVFVILFGVLAVIIGTLASGIVRIIAFAVLSVVALVIGLPILERVFNLAGDSLLAPSATTVTAPPAPIAILVPLLVFAGLAVLIGILLKETPRLIGFGILAAVAVLILGGPLRQQLFPNLFQGSNSSSPNIGIQQNRPTQQVPANSGGTVNSAGSSGPNAQITPTPQNPAPANPNGMGGPSSPIMPMGGSEAGNRPSQGGQGGGQGSGGVRALW